MAYISKEQVAEKTIKLKALNKEYGVKASFSGSNSISLTLTIHSGSINFFEYLYSDIWERNEGRHYLQLNQYYLSEWFVDSKALDYLLKAYSIMLEGHFDKSDSQSDYFYCSWYNHLQIGKWDKPYKVTG
jgi:uncharacterized protein YhdP